jgi:hypothetical protein
MFIIVVGAGLAAVAGLSAVLLAARKARRRQLAASVETATHPHYCAECDQEWSHAGQTCLRAWALPCPKCAGAPATAEAVSAGSRA